MNTLPKLLSEKNLLIQIILENKKEADTFMDLDYYNNVRASSGRQNYNGHSSLVEHNTEKKEPQKQKEDYCGEYKSEKKEYYKFKLLNKPKMYQEIKPARSNPFSSF
mmetsp:Transcript_25363/g.22486  ORF Transcript_25363/g.22486 Transcript_25363/m.22486 type:complete len:107 (-) Transcript_25363:1078-1398(-)